MSEVGSEAMREDLPPSDAFEEQEIEEEDEVVFAEGMTVLQQQVQKQQQQTEETLQEKYVRVMKCINLQDLLDEKGLATLYPDLYEDAVKAAKLLPEQAFFKLEKMIDIRVKRIVPVSDSFMENTSNKLSKEERELYLDVCQKAMNHSKKMHEILRLAKERQDENRDTSG